MKLRVLGLLSLLAVLDRRARREGHSTTLYAAPVTSAGSDDADLRYPTITPYLYYQDAAAAIDWLHRAFGFTERRRITARDGSVAHGEMAVGENGAIMFGSAGAEYESPRGRAAVPSSLYVAVDVQLRLAQTARNLVERTTRTMPLRKVAQPEDVAGELAAGDGDEVAYVAHPPRAGVVLHAADHARWDAQFPDHPLSRVRRTLDALAGAVQVVPEFSALPPFAP